MQLGNQFSQNGWRCRALNLKTFSQVTFLIGVNGRFIFRSVFKASVSKTSLFKCIEKKVFAPGVRWKRTWKELFFFVFSSLLFFSFLFFHINNSWKVKFRCVRGRSARVANVKVSQEYLLYLPLYPPQVSSNEMWSSEQSASGYFSDEALHDAEWWRGIFFLEPCSAVGCIFIWGDPIDGPPYISVHEKKTFNKRKWECIFKEILVYWLILWLEPEDRLVRLVL